MSVSFAEGKRPPGCHVLVLVSAACIALAGHDPVKSRRQPDRQEMGGKQQAEGDG